MPDNPYKSPEEESAGNNKLARVDGLPSVLRSGLIAALFSCAAGSIVGFVVWLSHVTSNPQLRARAFQDGAWLSLFYSDGKPTFMVLGVVSFIGLIVMRLSRR